MYFMIWFFVIAAVLAIVIAFTTLWREGARKKRSTGSWWGLIGAALFTASLIYIICEAIAQLKAG